MEQPVEQERNRDAAGVFGHRVRVWFVSQSEPSRGGRGDKSRKMRKKTHKLFPRNAFEILGDNVTCKRSANFAPYPQKAAITGAKGVQDLEPRRQGDRAGDAPSVS